MVRLNKEYIVEVDSYSYTLKRDSNKKIIKVDKNTGAETEEDQYGVVGYYGDLKGSIRGAIKDMNDRKLAKGTHELLEAIEIINKNNEKFERILKKAIKEVPER